MWLMVFCSNFYSVCMYVCVCVVCIICQGESSVIKNQWIWKWFCWSSKISALMHLQIYMSQEWRQHISHWHRQNTHTKLLEYTSLQLFLFITTNYNEQNEEQTRNRNFFLLVWLFLWLNYNALISCCRVNLLTKQTNKKKQKRNIKSS